MLLAGVIINFFFSSLVMFISALMYRGPQQITVLKRGLAALLKRDGFEHISDAVGIDA